MIRNDKFCKGFYIILESIYKVRMLYANALPN